MDPQLKSRLGAAGQAHLIKHADNLSGAALARFEAQIKAINFDQLSRLFHGHESPIDWTAVAARAKSPPAILLDDPNPKFTKAEARQHGEDALRIGEVAMILVAGGQGTRLGFNQPKGMFSIGPVSGRTLFQVIVDRLIAVGNRYGNPIPLAIMTSDATHEATVEYFKTNENLGLAEDQLSFFQQGLMPALDAQTGKILLAGQGQIALSPDGHGGMLAALASSGLLGRFAKDGIRHLYYGQIDNPLLGVCDPEFLGYHLLAQSEMTTQVVRKTDSAERVGVLAQVDGKMSVIEYSDLPTAAAAERDPAGALKFWAGSIAVHAMDVEFLQRVANDASSLPFHRALKKVPYLGEDGELVEPEKPNALKFERFIFDLLPSAKNAIVVEGKRQECFGPVKNADGAASDTPTTARTLMSCQHRQMLIDAGAQVAENAVVEIHPGFALDAEELKSKLTPGANYQGKVYLAPDAE
jgi:UDP-N-acetylglucosamine/UDP-N-acetylgalactosamine diphosphorylase